MGVVAFVAAGPTVGTSGDRELRPGSDALSGPYLAIQRGVHSQDGYVNLREGRCSSGGAWFNSFVSAEVSCGRR